MKSTTFILLFVNIYSVVLTLKWDITAGETMMEAKKTATWRTKMLQ
jgi:hypothetical protein